MAGCSKKQYAILMSAGEEGRKLASEMGGMEQEEFNDAFSQLMEKGGGYNRDDDEDYKDFDPDSDDDYGFDDDESEYDREMEKAQEENAAMSENEQEPSVELFNKFYDQVEGAGQEEFENDLQYQIQDAFEKGQISKDQYNQLFDKWEEKIGYESESDLTKGNPYDPEDLPDEGMSQEELNSIMKEPKESSVDNVVKHIQEKYDLNEIDKTTGKKYQLNDSDRESLSEEFNINDKDWEEIKNRINGPKEDDEWKVTSGAATAGGRGGHTDYDDGKGNWISDWGNGKVYAYLDGKSLGKKFSSVEEAKAALNKKKAKLSEAKSENLESEDDKRLREAEEKLGYRSHRSDMSPKDFQEKYKDYDTREMYHDATKMILVSDKNGNHIATYKPDENKIIEFEWLGK